MTISSQNRKAGPFVGNDSTTAFPFEFKVFAASDVQVVRANSSGVETTLVLNTDYTVSLNANQNDSPGGTVTLPAVLATGYRLTITSAITPLQSIQLTNLGGWYPDVMNAALDKLTILVQQVLDALGRSLKFPISDSAGGNPTLPGKDQRKGRVLAFHETSGDPVAGPTVSQLGTVSAALTAIQAVADDLTNINAVASDLTNINTVAADKTNIDTVAADKANIDAVAGNASNINAVAGNASNINAVAGNASNINAVVADQANIDAVAADLTAINAASGNAATASAQAAIATAEATSILSSVAAVTTAQAEANALLGLGIGGSTIDASGHLIMTYVPPVTSVSINGSGHLTLTY